MNKIALVIEDEVLSIRVIEQLLKLESVDVIALHISHEAEFSSKIQEVGNVDVIFLDLRFDNVSGLDLIKQLRQDEDFSHVPIIAYTVNFGNIALIYQHGFDGILGKPLDAETFPQQLHAIFQGEKVTYIP